MRSSPKSVCPILHNEADCLLNQNCHWISKTNKCSKKRTKQMNRTISKKTMKPVYQAKFIDIYDIIHTNTLSNNIEIEQKANEYVQNTQNGVGIGDILFCGTQHDRKEFGFYLVLPDKNNKNNKVVHCLNEGLIAGGVIDKKNILHKYNVKYDVMFVNSAKTKHYEYNKYFWGRGSYDFKLEHKIPYEFYKNKLMDRQFR